MREDFTYCRIPGCICRGFERKEGLPKNSCKVCGHSKDYHRIISMRVTV